MSIKPVILVVEDDKRVGQLILQSLEPTYVVFLAETFNEALHILKDKYVDAACLDIVLPDGNGLELCRIIKQRYKSTKIIVLSKKSLIEDRLKVFKTGADDYLPKPFFIDELSIRIKRLLNLINKGRSITQPPFTLNLDKAIFSYEQYSTNLTKNQTVILKTILTGAIKFCDIKTIQNSYSSYYIKIPSEETIKVTISRLRRKLIKEWGRDIIKTKYGFGYYLTHK